jgi:hypothetical protein
MNDQDIKIILTSLMQLMTSAWQITEPWLIFIKELEVNVFTSNLHWQVYACTT